MFATNRAKTSVGIEQIWHEAVGLQPTGPKQVRGLNKNDMRL